MKGATKKVKLKRLPASSPAAELARKLREGGTIPFNEWEASHDRGQTVFEQIDGLVKKAVVQDEPTANDGDAVSHLVREWGRLSRALRWACKGPSAEAAYARHKLVQQTSENIDLLHRLPQRQMRALAREMPSFPVMGQTHPTFRRTMEDQLKRLEVGKSVAPNFRSSARWKSDAFAKMAEEWLEALPFAHPNTDTSSRDEVELLWKDAIAAAVMLDPRSVELGKLIKAKGDRQFPSRLRQRVAQTVKARLFAMLGLNQHRGAKSCRT